MGPCPLDGDCQKERSTKCNEQYIGQSERSLQDRFSEHRDYVKQEKVGKATGWHFNKKGHTVHDMVVSILEKVHTSDKLQREERENMFIREFNTKSSFIE